MDKNVEHVLVDAIENKQSLTVVYLGKVRISGEILLG
ncbi:hypothetical protein BvCmsKSP023_00559 [Escherichia coli]|nr:hypothetical protein BvCmsKSP023_00559 [Escherichia coli]